MYILPNISRSEDNQTMKFGQLIGYNVMKNIFGEKLYTKFRRETIPKTLKKVKIENIFRS